MFPRKIINCIVFLLAISSCNINGQKYKTISVADFDKKMHEANIQLVDVRTPEEYAEKHLKDAVNMNFNGDDFIEIISRLDKTKPVLVYCLSGGRSSKAAALISKKGCTEVYNLDGGILAWTNAGLPVEKPAGSEAKAKGLDMNSYLVKVKSDKLVLVDFNAVWCGPCKTLKPILDRIAAKDKDKVTVLPLDVDHNPRLSDAMHIQGIPLMILYRDGKEVWRTLGLTDEETIQDAINSNSK
jgi:thioredoxin 1